MVTLTYAHILRRLCTFTHACASTKMVPVHADLTDVLGGGNPPNSQPTGLIYALPLTVIVSIQSKMSPVGFILLQPLKKLSMALVATVRPMINC